MPLHSALLLFPPTSTNAADDAMRSYWQHLVLESGSPTAVLGCLTPPCCNPRNLQWSRNPASKVLNASGSDYLGCSPEPIRSGNVLHLQGSSRAFTSAFDGQPCLLQLAKDLAKSSQAQPEKIKLGGSVVINNAPENLERTGSFTEKSPELSCNSFQLGGLWFARRRWPGAIISSKNPDGLTTLRTSRSENSCPKWFLQHPESRSEFNLDRLPRTSEIANFDLQIGNGAVPSDSRSCMKHPFEITSTKAPAVHLAIIGEFDQMVAKSNLRQNCGAQLTRSHPNSGATVSPSAWPTRFICPSIRLAKSRSTCSESTRSVTKNTAGNPTNRSLGWPGYRAIHSPLGQAKVVQRANSLAPPTTISAHSRPKTGCNAPKATTPTPTKTEP